MGLEKYGDFVRGSWDLKKDPDVLEDDFFFHFEHVPKVITDKYIERYRCGELSIAVISSLTEAARTGKSLVDKLKSIPGLTLELALEADTLYNSLRLDLLLDGIENNGFIDEFSQWMKNEARSPAEKNELNEKRTYESIKIMLDGSARWLLKARGDKLLQRVCKHPEVFCYGVLNNSYKTQEIDEVRKHAIYPPLVNMKPPIFDRNKNISEEYRKFSGDYPRVMYAYLLKGTPKKLATK